MKKNILFVEANQSEFEKVLEVISDDDVMASVHYKSLEDSFLVPAVELRLIVACLPFPGIDGDTGIRLLQRHFKNIPIVALMPDDGTASDQSSAKDTYPAPVRLQKSTLTEKGFQQAIDEAIAKNDMFFNIELKHANYKRHFYSSSIPIIIYDTDSFHILEVNQSAVDKYGISKEAFLTLLFTDIFPKEDVESFLEAHEAHDYGQFDTGYWRNVKQDGALFFVNIYTHYTYVDEKETGMSFLFDVNDKLLEDITNKNSQNLIKGQKEQFDSILSTLSDAVWSIRADTLELIYANNAFYKLFGFSPEEMTANIDPFFSLIHPDDQKAFRQSMQGVSYSGSARVEYRYNHRDGSLKTLQAHVTLIKGSEGKPDTLNGVTVDVTKERALQDKIRKSEQNLLATINNTKDLIWSVNTNLEIIFCNKPYQEYVYQISRTSPRPGDYVLGEWGSDDFIALRTNDYKRALAGESFITVVEEKFGGEVMYKEFSNNPIIDHEGKITGVNCIARDISEQRRQFMKIQQQNEKLKEIAWIQSHGVRAPVAAILGLIELFDYEAEGNAYNVEILEMLKKATQDLDIVIKKVVEKTEVLDQDGGE